MDFLQILDQPKLGHAYFSYDVLKFHNIQLLMKNNCLKNSERVISPKNHNLSELSISEIWENKFVDESSDFQQERYLINTIAQNQREMEHQYGLEFHPKEDSTSPISKNNIYEIRPRKDQQSSKSISQVHNSNDKSHSLAFNRMIKRKKNPSKEKILIQNKSPKKVEITKPVPSIQQHIFKPSQDLKFKNPNTKTTKAAKPIRILMQIGEPKIGTTIYQVPIQHQKYKNDHLIDRKNYHLMADDIKVEINDFNCELFEEPFVQTDIDIYNIRTCQQQSDRTIRNMVCKRIGHNNISSKSSQFTNLNETQTFTQASWVQSSNADTRVFQLKRPHSYDGRHQSMFSSTKTDRNVDSSPFSKDSSRTTKKVEKIRYKDIHIMGSDNKSGRVNKFFRGNIVKNGGDRNHQCLEYFQLSCLRGSLKNFKSN